MEQAWNSWLQVPTHKKIKSLPLLIYWGIWLERNYVIFKNKYYVTKLIAAQSLSILAHFPLEKYAPVIH